MDFMDIWEMISDFFYYNGEALLYIALAAVFLVILAVLHGLVAKTISRNRGMEGGFWWGFCFLGLGLLVVAFRPNDALIAKAISAIAAPGGRPVDDAPDLPADNVPNYPGSNVPNYPANGVPNYPANGVPNHPGNDAPNYPGNNTYYG